MKIVIAPDSYKECLSSREVAAAERNPIIASSKGVGELIMEAFWKGCRRLVIGLGGSATCDGGAGILSVPGVKDALRETTVELLCEGDKISNGFRRDAQEPMLSHRTLLRIGRP